MPEPGMEDSGGNPLQEGILGDWQNSKVRDEAFASVQEPEPDFEVEEVIVPDPDSLRADKRQMAQKQADFMDTLGDIGQVAAPVAGGVAGFALGGPAGAAIGAGLAGGGMEALNGGDVGDVAQTGLTDAALGGLGGVGAGALRLGTIGAGEAAAQGTTRGGIGSLMKSAWSKVPTDKLKSAYMTHSLLQDAQNATTPQAMPTGAPMAMGQPAPVVGPSYYSKTAAPTSTPTSQDHIPSNNTDDPEEVDFHERNDGEKDGLQSDQGVNDIGGSDLGPDDFFSADSGALSLFGELFPKILQFATGEESAAGDPDMEKLHQALEAEKPGYMDGANDDDGHKMIMFVMKGQPNSGDDSLSDNDAPHDPLSEHQSTTLVPGLSGTCPRCGSVIDPSSQHCPQCGMGNPNHQSLNPELAVPQAQAEGFPQAISKTAGGQGPNTPQQQALVSELLIQEGRQDEIPNMLMEPHEYADELAQITGGEEPPSEDIGQEGPPPPAEPPQEGQGMPVPPMSGQPMMAAVAKYAGTVDGIAEPCPNCNGHSTGYTDYEDGKLGCKSCGHSWTGPKLIQHDASAFEDPTDTVEAPSPDQPEEEQDERGSLSWTDESGAPLQVGQTYDMYSENYDIPDPVKIDAVKPDVIEYTILGEYGLSHRTEITHDEASIQNISFVPSNVESEPAPEEAGQGAQDPGAMPGMEQSDLSQPHMTMAGKTADFDDINGPYGPNASGPDPDEMCPKCGSSLYDEFDYGPNEQERKCQHCHTTWRPHRADPLEQAFQAPSVEHPLGGEDHLANLSAHEVLTREAGTVDEEDHMDPDLQWLKGGGRPTATRAESHVQASQEPQEETGPEWLMQGVPRTSGAKMSPWEQRGYIDETGDARNSDKLDLAGTHYEVGDLDDAFLFGL